MDAGCILVDCLKHGIHVEARRILVDARRILVDAILYLDVSSSTAMGGGYDGANEASPSCAYNTLLASGISLQSYTKQRCFFSARFQIKYIAFRVRCCAHVWPRGQKPRTLRIKLKQE